MFPHQKCVVLNNHYQEKIKEAAAASTENAAAISIFQPYTKKHLRDVSDLISKEDHVPVFLVAGNYGDVASGVGILRSVEYSDEITEIRKQEAAKHIMDSEGLYALNILSITNVTALRKPIPFSFFVKARNAEPLSPGQWPASVCYSPNLAALIAAI